MPETPRPPEISQADFSPKEKFDHAIRQAVTQAYQEVALEYQDRLMDPSPEEIYWQPMCQEFSEKLMAKLKAPAVRELNLNPTYIYINKLPQQFKANFRHHIFLSVKGPDGEIYFIDGTWQQFADQPDKKNRLMLESSDQIMQSAQDKKVPADVSGLWQIGLNMISSRKALQGIAPDEKSRLKHAVALKLNIPEKDLEDFLNLKSNFSLENSGKIAEAFQAAKPKKKS